MTNIPQKTFKVRGAFHVEFVVDAQNQKEAIELFKAKMAGDKDVQEVEIEKVFEKELVYGGPEIGNVKFWSRVWNE